jgi:uncharacterized protein
MPDLTLILLLLLAGGIAGFLAGFFGVGGGIILVPILILFYGSLDISSLVSTHIAFGTSLFVVVFASAVSAQQYARNGFVVWKAVAWIGVASVLGAVFGSYIAAGLEGKSLQKIFGLVVAVAAIRLMGESRRPKSDDGPRLAPPGLAGMGIFVGLVSSLAGVGGGVFSIPMMYYFFRFPLKKALGTSSASIVITATASAAGYIVSGWNSPLLPGHTLGYVDYLHAIPVIAATIPMAWYGARVSQQTHVDKLRKLYAVFLIVIALKMLLF